MKWCLTSGETWRMTNWRWPQPRHRLVTTSARNRTIPFWTAILTRSSCSKKWTLTKNQQPWVTIDNYSNIDLLFNDWSTIASHWFTVYWRLTKAGEPALFLSVTHHLHPAPCGAQLPWKFAAFAAFTAAVAAALEFSAWGETAAGCSSAGT